MTAKSALTEEDAFDHGKDGAERGASPAENPFLGTPLGGAWLRGWKDGARRVNAEGEALAALRRNLRRAGLDPEKTIANMRDPAWVAAFNKGPAKIEMRPHPGKFFREFREEQGLSRRAVAADLGISERTLRRLETGDLITNDAGWSAWQTALFVLASKKMAGAR
jgi:DNA-binding XRE family transcriptional regulator